MFPVRFLCLALALVCAFALCVPALAVQVDSDTSYCFTQQDFSSSEDPLMGICITQLPRENGTVLLGSRVLQPGDILTAGQIEQMTFMPLAVQYDAQATMSYLPIYENRVEQPATMTISIRGKEDLPPAAQDSALETYKNLPNTGKLKAEDPEGKPLTYTLVRAPKRGDVTVHEDGSFTYTPKKNKVGVDSFTYTAADPAGNVSREATVTVQILKPTDARQYTDTAGLDCQFEAEWLRNTGLFVGESISGESCFYPDKPVSRGEFIAMLVQTLDIPVEKAVSLDADVPGWLQPYLTAALRSGFLAYLPEESADLQQTVTGAEAAVMVQNALDLSASRQLLEAVSENAESEAVPAWAQASLTILEENGISLAADQALTRADAAQVLYQTFLLCADAPGAAVFQEKQ